MLPHNCSFLKKREVTGMTCSFLKKRVVTGRNGDASRSPGAPVNDLRTFKPILSRVSTRAFYMQSVPQLGKQHWGSTRVAPAPCPPGPDPSGRPGRVVPRDRPSAGGLRSGR